jgi:predicted amidohydrolase YtcJ
MKRSNSICNSVSAWALAFILASCSDKSEQAADTVIINAVVYTVDAKNPSAEGIAIRNGKIIALGDVSAVKKFISDATEVIDAKGQFVMPGFIEGHGHIHGLGASLIELDLMKAKSWSEIVSMVEEACKKAKPGEWVIGRGWHQEKWDTGPSPAYLGYPYHESLDAVSSLNPVLLTHASGHSSIVNAAALKLAGISSSTPSPKGGDIVKDKEGKIVGVLEETAQGLATEAFRKWLALQPEQVIKDKWKKSIALAEEACLRKGVTSFQDAGSSFEQVQWLKELAEAQALRIRHWVMVRESNGRLRTSALSLPITGLGDGHLTVKAVKVSLDGALGSYGAWLLEPYNDRKGWVGLNTYNIDSLKAIADYCWEKNLQLCVHAIGDRANREVIDIYANQIQTDSSRDHRWRVEHAQHVHPDEIPRFKKWNVIASMQSVHCTSDAPFVVKRLGEDRAASGAYMWRAFLDAGVVVNNGTDVPVEDVDPLACLYAAVTRKQKNGQSFYPEQKMTREEALYSYTMANAFAAFEEKWKGSIEKEKWADLVMLDTNLLTCADEDILKANVVMTLVNGKVQYKK